MFGCFDTTAACVRQTDRQTDWHTPRSSTCRATIASSSKNSCSNRHSLPFSRLTARTTTRAVSSELYRFLWPPNRAGHYILQLWFLLSFFFFSSLAYSQRSQIGCLSYLHSWCGLRSEMCCTRLAENIGRKNYAKNRHLRTIAECCRAISSQVRNVSSIGKKMLNSNISSTRPHNMANVGPLTAEIGWRVWGTPTNFNRFFILFHLVSFFFFFLLFFPRLISAVGDWMSTILRHMVWS